MGAKDDGDLASALAELGSANPAVRALLEALARARSALRWKRERQRELRVARNIEGGQFTEGDYRVAPRRRLLDDGGVVGAAGRGR